MMRWIVSLRLRGAVLFFNFCFTQTPAVFGAQNSGSRWSWLHLARLPNSQCWHFRVKLGWRMCWRYFLKDMARDGLQLNSSSLTRWICLQVHRAWHCSKHDDLIPDFRPVGVCVCVVCILGHTLQWGRVIAMYCSKVSATYRRKEYLGMTDPARNLLRS